MNITVRSFFAAALAAIALVACATAQDEVALRRIYAIGLHFSPWDDKSAPGAAQQRQPVTGSDVIPPGNANMAQAFNALMLLKEGEALAKQQDYGQALARYDEIDSHFGKSDDLAIKRIVARSLFDKGNLLAWRKVDTDEELEATRNAALVVHDDLDRRFGKDGDEQIREQVAKSLVDKSAIQIYKRNPPMSLIDSNAVEKRYGDLDTPILREAKLMALSNRGAALGLQGHYRDALDQFDELERTYDADQAELERRHGKKGAASMRDLLDLAKRAREVVEKNRSSLR